MTLRLPPLRATPSPNFSSRGGARVDKIIVHSCEGNYAGAINWFAQARSQVSAHIVLREDGGEATQCVAFANKAWACCAFNAVTENIEAAGFESKGFADAEWGALAAIVAFRLHVNRLPCRWAEKGIGEGYARHYDLGPAGGNHCDPTTDTATWEAFRRRVEAAYALAVPDSWKPDLLPEPAPSMPACYTPSNDVRHDFQPPSLEWVQASLNRLGIPHVPLIVDGIEGLQTRSAIVDFQQAHRLWIDGDAGPDTVAAIEKSLAA